MGYKLTKFTVTPEENEQIDAIVQVQKESRSVIHGVVLDEHNKPIKDAVVKLLKVKCSNNPKHPDHLEPITHAFTDNCGQFLFGPLCPHVKYVVKVWVNHVKTRELIIKPEHCNDKHCLGNHYDDKHCDDKNCDDHNCKCDDHDDGHDDEHDTHHNDFTDFDE